MSVFRIFPSVLQPICSLIFITLVLFLTWFKEEECLVMVLYGTVYKIYDKDVLSYNFENGLDVRNVKS